MTSSLWYMIRFIVKKSLSIFFLFSLNDLFNTINHILIDLQSPSTKMGVAKVQVIHFDWPVIIFQFELGGKVKRSRILIEVLFSAKNINKKEKLIHFNLTFMCRIKIKKKGIFWLTCDQHHQKNETKKEKLVFWMTCHYPQEGKKIRGKKK